MPNHCMERGVYLGELLEHLKTTYQKMNKPEALTRTATVVDLKRNEIRELRGLDTFLVEIDMTVHEIESQREAIIDCAGPETYNLITGKLYQSLLDSKKDPQDAYDDIDDITDALALTYP